jgi:putative ABC transport system ATP-binding protein
MIHIQDISKSYTDKEGVTTIFEHISLDIPSGQKIAIIGPSGSGKSTLLSIIAGLDKPSAGSVFYDDINIHTMPEKQLSRFRNEKVGIIFQAFELVQFFTAYENVLLPLSIRSHTSTIADVHRAIVDDLFVQTNLAHRRHSLPATLSGCEQQRVAIARVLASGCEVICADEPTGNLDTSTGKKILDLLLASVDKDNKTLILITHDMHIARQMDVIYEIRDGALTLVSSITTQL